MAGSGIGEDARHVMSSVSIGFYRTWLASMSNASCKLPTWCGWWPALERGRCYARAVASHRTGSTAAIDGGWPT